MQIGLEKIVIILRVESSKAVRVKAGLVHEPFAVLVVPFGYWPPSAWKDLIDDWIVALPVQGTVLAFVGPCDVAVDRLLPMTWVHRRDLQDWSTLPCAVDLEVEDVKVARGDNLFH